MVVDEFMTREIVSVNDDETVLAAAELWAGAVGSVIVTSNEKPLGIFTERDLLSTFIARSRSLDIPIGKHVPGYDISSSRYQHP